MKSIKFNFIMNAILTVSGVLFPLITFPYISRVLEADGVGKITFLTSIVSYFVLFSQLGIPTYGIRACARVRDDREKLTKTVQELFFINSIMTVLSYIALFLIYNSVERLREDSLLFLILSTAILLNQFGMEWLYKSLEKYTYITTLSITFRALAIILMFIFVREKSDYVIYGAITVFAASMSNILNFINIRKYVDFYKIKSAYSIRKHIRPIMVFFALSCATTIYTNLDMVMLGFVHDDTAVGYYNAAVRLKVILMSVVTSLGVVLLPRLSYYIQNGDRDKFLEISIKAFHFILLISLPLSVYFILQSENIINFLAGSGYNESVLPMQIILPTVILIGITNLFGIQILVPLGKEKLVLYSVFVGVVINLILNIFLIPKYSYVGTAISNLIAEIGVLVVQIYFVRDMIKDMIKNVNYLSLVIALALSSIISNFSMNYTENIFVTLCVTAVLFFATYYVVLRISGNKLITEIEKQVFARLRR